MAKSRRGGRLWSELSPSYRARLRRGGIDRQQWLSGADLRAARSHRPVAPAEAAPKEATTRLVAGEATPGDIRAIEAWQRPEWLPGSQFDMSDDVAAAVSQLGNPKTWGHVSFTPAAEGEPWTMTVTPKRHMSKDGTVRTHAYDKSVEIPGGGGTGTTGAREVLDWLAEEGVGYDVMGS